MTPKVTGQHGRPCGVVPYCWQGAKVMGLVFFLSFNTPTHNAYGICMTFVWPVHCVQAALATVNICMQMWLTSYIYNLIIDWNTYPYLSGVLLSQSSITYESCFLHESVSLCNIQNSCCRCCSRYRTSSINGQCELMGFNNVPLIPISQDEGHFQRPH